MIYRFRSAVLFTLLLLIPLSALSDQTDTIVPNNSAKLLILGDSLSAAYGLDQQEGWVSLLQKRWRDENISIDIVNAAVSGETTDGGLARLPRLIEQHTPSHILVELGGNDGLQGHSISKIRDNLSAIIRIAKSDNTVVFVQDMQIPTNYGKRYTQMFSDTFETVSEQHEVTKIPFFLEDIALQKDLMQRDGIHPNAEAQPMIVDFMFEKLTPLIINKR